MITAVLAAVTAREEESSLAGPLALLMIVLLGIATVLLIRNMNKRLRRLPADFDSTGADGAAKDAETSQRPDSAG